MIRGSSSIRMWCLVSTHVAITLENEWPTDSQCTELAHVCFIVRHLIKHCIVVYDPMYVSVRSY